MKKRNIVVIAFLISSIILILMNRYVRADNSNVELIIPDTEVRNAVISAAGAGNVIQNGNKLTINENIINNITSLNLSRKSVSSLQSPKMYKTKT